MAVHFVITDDGQPIGSASWGYGRWTTNGAGTEALRSVDLRWRHLAALGLGIDDPAAVLCRTWGRNPMNSVEVVPVPLYQAPVFVPLTDPSPDLNPGSTVLLGREGAVLTDDGIAASAPRSLPLLLHLLGTSEVRAVAVNWCIDADCRSRYWIGLVRPMDRLAADRSRTHAGAKAA